MASPVPENPLKNDFSSYIFAVWSYDFQKTLDKQHRP